MPLREYECNKCERIIEKLEMHGVVLDDTLDCPWCFEKGSLIQIISAPNHKLLGDGFYKPSATKKGDN